jgi:chemotaxis protein CheZ
MQENQIAGLAAELADLRRFIDRRFSELSTEVHATVQLVDYSENNISGQLRAMHEQLAAVLALPTTETRNSGLELEAVVQATEEAANRIMEAAEAIGDWVGQSGGGAGGDTDLRELVVARVNAIFEACSFQDLTSQRIRRAIEHLHKVDTMLGALSGVIPAAPAQATPTVGAGPGGTGADLAQEAIDRMLAG